MSLRMAFQRLHSMSSRIVQKTLPNTPYKSICYNDTCSDVASCCEILGILIATTSHFIALWTRENQAGKNEKMKPVRQLTSAQKKRVKLEETAGRIADIIMGHLATLPKAERKIRIAKADKRVQDALKRHGSAGTQATPSGRDDTHQIRLVARSRS